MSPPIILGYWDIRAYAQPIRLLLAAVGEDFVDKLYKTGGPPDFSKESWYKDRDHLGLDFPNLPYLIDGDVRLSQSFAILRYLGRKHRLDGQNDHEKNRIDLVESQLLDFREEATDCFYGGNFQNDVIQYKKGLPEKLTAFSQFLGSNPWFAGQNQSYVDFLAYELFDQHKHLVPEMFNDVKFKNLSDFMARFESQPRIQSYMKSDKFIKYPLCGDIAGFGSRFNQ